MMMTTRSKHVHVFFSMTTLIGLLLSFPESMAFVPQRSRGIPNLFRTAARIRMAADDDTSNVHQISIEYCRRCRWGLRGFWTAQELLSTFRDDDNLGAVTLIPSATPGRFAVTAKKADGKSVVLWNRDEAEGFPEMKDLKQLVRDEINPARFLGHSDSTERQEKTDPAETKDTIIDLSKEQPEPNDVNLKPKDVQDVPTPHLTISYCTGCQWLLRAAYVAQELVSTFSEEIHAVTLLPRRRPAKGGAFLVTVDGAIIWDRFEQGRFPETKELEQLVRDVLHHSKHLGHIDVKNTAAVPVEEMDDDEAAEARKFFGVM
uniref:Selenoprotein W n=1 Tax=Amphora coffeiformis TaxID=265554 RepID=A0A7S3L752_9STRA